MFQFLEGKQALKNDMIIVTACARYLESALERWGLLKCQGSSSPNLGKVHSPGDQEALNEKSSATSFQLSLLTLWFLPDERPDISSTVRLLCSRFRSPDQKD